MVTVKHSQSSQNSKFAMSLQYLKKELRDEADFWMLININVFFKLISTLLASKFPTRWCYHYWWTWSSILKVLKVTNLQYLYNISKKKLEMEFIFYMQINIKTSTSWIIVFDESSQTCPKSQNRKFVKYVQYINKKYRNCFCVLLWCKTFRYFMGFHSCLLLLVSGWFWSKMGVVF